MVDTRKVPSMFRQALREASSLCISMSSGKLNPGPWHTLWRQGQNSDATQVITHNSFHSSSEPAIDNSKHLPFSVPTHTHVLGATPIKVPFAHCVIVSILIRSASPALKLFFRGVYIRNYTGIFAGKWLSKVTKNARLLEILCLLYAQLHSESGRTGLKWRVFSGTTLRSRKTCMKQTTSDFQCQKRKQGVDTVHLEKTNNSFPKRAQDIYSLWI